MYNRQNYIKKKPMRQRRVFAVFLEGLQWKMGGGG